MADGGFTARAVGAIQILGGGLEIALGVGGIVTPEPLTTVGGVILVTHGSDTVVAGFRSLFYGEVQQSFTQQGAQATASALGASPQTSRRIGIGVDIAAGIGPSIVTSIGRRVAIAGAQHSGSRVAIAYLNQGAMRYGHNAVGVTVNNSTAWFHLSGLPRATFSGIAPGAVPRMGFVVTELAVTGTQAGRAARVSRELMRAGEVTWKTMGPNCTTTALQVLRQAGVVVPAWSQTPFLLYTGVKLGSEITVVGGAAATVAPALSLD